MSKYINLDLLKTDIAAMSDEEKETKAKEWFGGIVFAQMKMGEKPKFEELVEYLELSLMLGALGLEEKDLAAYK